MKSFVLVLALVGCSGGIQEAAEASYLSQQLACVDKAKTIEESKACRQQVKTEWAARDGGAK